jgi:hypothetical protein
MPEDDATENEPDGAVVGDVDAREPGGRERPAPAAEPESRVKDQERASSVTRCARPRFAFDKPGSLLHTA